jgi:hypothetical protein
VSKWRRHADAVDKTAAVCQSLSISMDSKTSGPVYSAGDEGEKVVTAAASQQQQRAGTAKPAATVAASVAKVAKRGAGVVGWLRQLATRAQREFQFHEKLLSEDMRWQTVARIKAIAGSAADSSLAFTKRVRELDNVRLPA